MANARSKFWESPAVRIALRRQSDILRSNVGKSADSCIACGVWPFVTGDDDPFSECCAWHDALFVLQEQGTLTPDWTLNKVNTQFYKQMMIVCAHEQDESVQRKLYQRAAIYILIVSTMSQLFW